MGRGRAAGLALLAAAVLFSVAGPLLVQADPARQDLSNILLPPSGEFLLGTDHLGRSVLARLAHAAQVSLALGAASVAAAAAIGVSLGAGWIAYLITGFIGACILIAIGRMVRR